MKKHNVYYLWCTLKINSELIMQNDGGENEEFNKKLENLYLTIL